MHSLKYIIDNYESFAEQMKARDPTIDLEGLRELNSQKKHIEGNLQTVREEKNKISRLIGRLKRESAGDLENLTERALELSLGESVEKKALNPVEKQINNILLNLPNVLDHRVPMSSREEDYLVIKSMGDANSFSFEPKDHLTIGKNLGIIDMDRASKLTGSNFVIYRGKGAEMEMALNNYFKDVLLGYTPVRGKNFDLVSPPLLVNRDTMTTAGTLPKFEEQLYKVEEDGFILIPTSEVALVGQYMNEKIPEEDLPILNTAFTHNFRREAGAYGKRDKGISRMHEFTKQEMVAISDPDYSEEVLQYMRGIAEDIVESLGLPARTTLLSAGDLGQQCAITYDIEVHFPSQDMYREVSSVSNCREYQARRGNIRVKRGKGSDYAHTLNGTALAIPRTMISILENYQQKNGNVTIPEVLRPYMRGAEEISRER